MPWTGGRWESSPAACSLMRYVPTHAVDNNITFINGQVGLSQAVGRTTNH